MLTKNCPREVFLPQDDWSHHSYFLSDGLLLKGLFNFPGSGFGSLVTLVATADLVTLAAVVFASLLLSAEVDLAPAVLLVVTVVRLVGRDA